jgi:hypothetical protein
MDVFSSDIDTLHIANSLLVSTLAKGVDMRPTEVVFKRVASSLFVKEFEKQLQRYGWWYEPIVREQMIAAHAIDALERPYAVRERIVQALDLCTRMRLNERRVTGYAVSIGAALYVLLFSRVPMVTWLQDVWFPLTVCINTALHGLLFFAMYIISALFVAMSRWYRRELSSIMDEVCRLDQLDAATFRSDLFMIGAISRDNQRIADLIVRTVRSHRSR